MIRIATSNDLADILSIEKKVFKHPWSKEQLSWELNSQPAAENYVMIARGNMIGYLFSHVVDDDVQILNIAIDIPFQHKGYGEQLLSYFLDQFNTDISIHLEVRKSNFPAINLYLKFGFHETGTRKGYYADGEDAIIMQRYSLIHGLV
ncbi:Ribosomal-protein-S18p-alanine acetyltransferase [hydrothermal vent metagenome]|uniref:Ribosomal-protein-S18p-alanine acetyltransferase n=1 Tax=hydrothermal vent metagenome TaxID=652676 RepID=A0A160VG62_9ZZZZ